MRRCGRTKAECSNCGWRLGVERDESRKRRQRGLSEGAEYEERGSVDVLCGRNQAYV